MLSTPRLPSALCLASLALAAPPVAASTQCAGQPVAGPRWQPGAYPTGSRILAVGPDRKFKSPSQAAKAARDGDVVEIDAGVYVDTAVWKQSGLIIRGVGGRPRLMAPQQLAQSKAIWVVSGRDVTIENVEMTGARVPDRNGAGIRAQGKGLTVRASCFHDNENGILTTNDPDNWLVVEHTEFANNGHGDGKSHNVYVGRVARFELRFSLSRDARQGHLVKSRAARNVIEYNRLVDGPDGRASYEIDLPSGGDSLVRGNLVVQGASSPNQGVVSYSAEARNQPSGKLTVAYNTLFSARANPVFVANASTIPADVLYNVYSGAVGTQVRGPANESGNVVLPASALADPRQGDFRPRPDARLATPSRTDADESIIPQFEPTLALGGEPRDPAALVPGAFNKTRR